MQGQVEGTECMLKYTRYEVYSSMPLVAATSSVSSNNDIYDSLFTIEYVVHYNFLHEAGQMDIIF